jgi:hypothetical protein
MGPLVILSIVLMQGATIVNAYSLTWWTENSFNKGKGFYLGIYAGLGVAVAIFTFAMVSLLCQIRVRLLEDFAHFAVFHALRVSLLQLWALTYLSNYITQQSHVLYMHL